VRRNRVRRMTAVAAAAAAVFATASAAQVHVARVSDGSRAASPLQQILDWIKAPAKAKKVYRIAWLKADANNPYTIAERNGGLAAAKVFGASVKVFDAAFNPTTQLRQLQDALTAYNAHKFDGIVVEPVAGQVICGRVKAAVAAGVPVAVDNQPLCGDDGYTEGTVGYAGLQLQRYFDAHVRYAFSSCKTKCEAAVITGPVGFDVTTKGENAVKTMSARYPNVKVVVNQASDFSAQQGFSIMRDALTAHPNIEVVISEWDDEMVGVIRAIKAAGKTPGKDVRIYSNGADKTGTALVRNGSMTETTMLQPYEEGFYAMHEMMRYLITGKKTVGTLWTGEDPLVKKIGSLFITKANVGKWKPEY